MVNTSVNIYNMMLIEYKGHQGTMEIDIENNIIYGHLLGVNAIDGYDGATPQEFMKAFKDAVDDAIEDGIYK